MGPPRRSRHQSRYRARLEFGLIAAAAIFATFWFGLVPPRFSPFAPVNLSEPDSWFLDFRLAALRHDVSQCKAALTSPLIGATPVADAPFEKGCGWRNAVHVTHAGGAHLGVDKISCEMAAALTMWLTHEVQPAARQYLQSDVKSVQHMGVYACRNIIGKASVAAFRSQHARANAIDVDAFVLTDGRTISVARFWKGDGPETKFLHAIKDRACRYFRVALGPDYNAAHSNHFHLDRGAFRSCR